MPDVIPLVGYVDDALLVAALIDGLLTYVDRRLVLRYWPGTAESLDSLARAARLLSVWVPARLRASDLHPRRLSATRVHRTLIP